jgi:glycosyltransferase involved in cell wall biosynthesis
MGKRDRGIAVSLTPLPLEADSRAFRAACSLAEAGFCSIVIEGQRSQEQFWPDSIEVISLGTAPGPKSWRLRGAAASLRAGKFGSIGEFALYAGFRGYDWWRHRQLPHAGLPNADIYYLHSFEMHRLIASQAARLGARIIYDAHDFYRGIDPPDRQLPFDRNRMRPFFNRLEDRLVAKADAVVTVSDGIAGLMEAVFGRRPTVIRNCHDERCEAAVSINLRDTIGLDPADCLAVVVGNHKPGMAVMAACNAIARLPDRLHLAFVGRGYDKIATEIPTHLLHRVHFGHCVAPNRVVPFITAADLGLVLYEPYSDNYRYALPNGFFQVVAARLPVIRGRLPEIEAVISKREIGVCLDPIEPAALAAAIAHCAREATTLCRNVADLAHELRWEVESTRLHRLVDGLMTQRVGATRAIN